MLRLIAAHAGISFHYLPAFAGGDPCRQSYERTVLARDVHMHVHDRILVSQNKTVVFD